MVSGDRPGPIVGRAIVTADARARRSGAVRARGTALLLAVLALATLALLLTLLPAQPAAAAPETQWVLTQTLVNPDKEKLEYRGGGSDPEFFGEERFKDTVMIFKPSATSFSVKDRWQDREYIAWDVTITCNFSAPEKTLLPGKPYKLTAKFSHTGTTHDPHPGETFSYSASDFSLDPNEPLSYYPSNPDPPSKTWTFTAPTASPGATMEIYAGLWNSPGCTVIWKYEARAVTADATSTTKPATTSSSTTTTKPSTTTSSTVAVGERDPSRRSFSDEEFEKALADTVANNGTMHDGYVGIVIACMGDFEIYDYSGLPRKGVRGSKIRIGDSIVTHGHAGVNVQMADRDELRDAGPSVINIASNSEMVFKKWHVSFKEPRGETITQLIFGAVRIFFEGWGRNSSVSVKTGATICGIRGSDVFISYDPTDEKVAASVLKGHMDVTSSRTGKTEDLTALQSVVVRDGEIGKVYTFTEEQWSGMVNSHGLGDMQPLSTEEWEALVYGETPTTTPPTTAGVTPTTAPPADQGATGGQEPATSTQEEFEQMLADVATFADSGLGDRPFHETGLLKQGYIGLLGSVSGELSVYDHAGQAVDLSAPRIEAKDRGYLVPIRVGDTIRIGSGEAIVYLFTRFLSERLVVEIEGDTEVVFASTGNAIMDVSPTLLRIVRGMIRFRYTAESSSDTLSLEVGANLWRAGPGSDVVISYDPGEGIGGVWAREGNMDVISSRTGESEFLGDGWGVVMEEGKDDSHLPLEDDRWDDITLGSTLDDVKPCQVLAVEQTGRPDGRPLALVEFEESNLSLILAVVIPVVVVLAAAAGVGMYLLRRRRRRAAGGAVLPAGGEPAAPASVVASTDSSAFSPALCRYCGSPRRPGIVFCESCGKKLDA